MVSKEFTAGGKKFMRIVVRDANDTGKCADCCERPAPSACLDLDVSLGF